MAEVVEDPKVVGDETPVEVKTGDKPPETVPWNKYVGIKEKFTRVEGELKTKISGLEEQAKTAISADEHTRIKTELETTKTTLQTTSDELKGVKEKTVTEKRDALVKRGIAEEKVKDMSVEQLDGIIGALEGYKPKPDLGGGGGGGDAPTKAKEKMQSGFGSLHPNK